MFDGSPYATRAISPPRRRESGSRFLYLLMVALSNGRSENHPRAMGLTRTVSSLDNRFGMAMGLGGSRPATPPANRR